MTQTLNACACMYPGCAKAGFCIAQNPGRPIPDDPLPVYWREPAPYAEKMPYPTPTITVQISSTREAAMTADTPKTPQAAEPALPPLPQAIGWLGLWAPNEDKQEVYTAAQMREYAREALAAAPAEPAQERAAAAQLPVNANWCSTFPKSAAYIINQVAARVDELEAALSARAPAVEPAVFGPLESFAHEVAIGAYEPYELRSAAKRALQASAAAPPVEPAPSEPDDTKKWLEAHSDATRRMKAALRDPVTVHAALLRGEIAKPDIRDMLHVYGAEALARWDRSEPTRDEAMERTDWTIIAPDGRQWHGESAIRAAAAAQRDTIDPVLAMQRINAALDEWSAEDRAMERDAARWRDLLAAVMRELPSRSTFSGNAPGHCHNIPGVWDSDNGALSGKSCAWCMTWAAARAALAQAQPGPVVKQPLTTEQAATPPAVPGEKT